MELGGINALNLVAAFFCHEALRKIIPCWVAFLWKSHLILLYVHVDLYKPRICAGVGLIYGKVSKCEDCFRFTHLFSDWVGGMLG